MNPQDLIRAEAAAVFQAGMNAIFILGPYLLIPVAVLILQIAVRRRRRRHLLESQRGIETLRALSWRDFERLVGEAYRRQGYSVTECGLNGNDGGVDLELRRGPEKIVVQCKRWKKWTVGVPVVRELLGAMVAEGATAGIVVTSGRFTRDAITFAQGKPITLIDGTRLLALVQSVQTTPQALPNGGSTFATEDAQVSAHLTAPQGRPSAHSATPESRAPAHSATPGSPSPASAIPSSAAASAAVASAPHCPACGAAMVRRTARKGANAGQEFWGCPGYPGCRGTRPG